MPVPVEEEISIVSSSASSSPALSNSSKSSINIMSSSSSEAEVSSTDSIKFEASESIKSEKFVDEPIEQSMQQATTTTESINEPHNLKAAVDSIETIPDSSKPFESTSSNETVKTEISGGESVKSEKSSSWSTESSVSSVKSEASIASAESNTSKASKISKASMRSVKSAISKTSTRSTSSKDSNVSKDSKASKASKDSKASTTISQASVPSTRAIKSATSKASTAAAAPKATPASKAKKSLKAVAVSSEIVQESTPIVPSRTRNVRKKKVDSITTVTSEPKSPTKSPVKAKVTKAAPVKRLGMTGRRTKAAVNPVENEESAQKDEKEKVTVDKVAEVEPSNAEPQENENSEPLVTSQPILTNEITEPIVTNGTKPSLPFPTEPTTPLPNVAVYAIATPDSKRPTRKAKKSIDPSEFEEFDAEMIRKLAVGSTRRRKIRSEEGDWIDPDDLEGRTIDHQPPSPPEPKRKRKYTRKVEDLDDPFRLIWLNDYSVEADAEEDERAPFRVEIDISVLCLLDFHSHLFASEIIGLLGGSFDETGKLMRISTVFPCKSSHSTGTEVDVDPLSEMEAGEHFERSGVRMIGWYHSHPNFEPNPSLRDLETQTMYQGLCRSVDGGQEAFVGIIVNPYLAVTESSSHIECFYVAQSAESGIERLPFRLPMHLTGVLNESLLLTEMSKLVEEAGAASDALDMQKNSERGVKRVSKLLKSLCTHAKLDESHPFIGQLQLLFSKLNFNVLERTEEDYSF